MALRSHLNEATVWRSLGRLAKAGWLENIAGARDERAAIWRLKIPKEAGDRRATIQRAEKGRDRLLQVDPSLRADGRADLSGPVIPFLHDAFRWKRGLGPIKGEIYSLLEKPLKVNEVAELMGYRSLRNARVHLKKLVQHGLVQRGADGRYERGEADLDAVADHLGTLGATAAQDARYRRERASCQALQRAYETWKRTGEVVDPETGLVLESGEVPPKRATKAAFRRQVLSGRMLNEETCPRVEKLRPLDAQTFDASTALESPQAARSELIRPGGALDSALSAAIGMIEQAFPGATLVATGWAVRAESPKEGAA